MLIDRIEAIIHRDVGRGLQPLFAATQGGLFSAAAALAADPAPRVGLITGFFVPGGQPPAAETDGPVGTALLARGLLDAGLDCRVVTDTVCASAVRCALDSAGAAAVPLDEVAPGEALDVIIEAWRCSKVTWALAVERCGPAANGLPHNMRGLEISTYTAALDRLFLAGPWRTIAIGDGGNEIGMGCMPRFLVERHIAHGARIGCVVASDYLIAAGVSHWGAYALLAALALSRHDWAAAMRGALDPALDSAVLEAMVRDGPAVDGVTQRQESTIDALPLAAHHRMLAEILATLP